jgi:hypothetical protein
VVLGGHGRRVDLLGGDTSVALIDVRVAAIVTPLLVIILLLVLLLIVFILLIIFVLLLLVAIVHHPIVLPIVEIWLALLAFLLADLPLLVVLIKIEAE